MTSHAIPYHCLVIGRIGYDLGRDDVNVAPFDRDGREEKFSELAQREPVEQKKSGDTD